MACNRRAEMRLSGSVNRSPLQMHLFTRGSECAGGAGSAGAGGGGVFGS